MTEIVNYGCYKKHLASKLTKNIVYYTQCGSSTELKLVPLWGYTYRILEHSCTEYGKVLRRLNMIEHLT